MLLSIGLSACSGSAGGVNVWDAVLANDTAKLERFASAGGNVNAQKWNGVTPLFLALSEEQRRSYKKLLELGANPNIIADDGRVVVNYAAGKTDPFWLRLALKHGGKPDLYNEAPNINRRGTPMYFAIHMGSFENIKLLVEHGANINAISEFGETPLSEAMGTARFDIVLYLLKQEADYTQLNPHNPPKSFLALARSRRLEWFRLPEDRKQLRAVWRWLKDRGVKLGLEERGINLDDPGPKEAPE